MNKKMLLIVGILLVVCLGIGGKMYMDKKKLQEDMVKIVKSNEAKEVFEQGLTNIDPKAFTPEGVIQSYEIDYPSIKRNPMGGINVTLYVNNDTSLYIKKTLNKFDGITLEGGGGGYSSKLDKKIKERNND